MLAKVGCMQRRARFDEVQSIEDLDIQMVPISPESAIDRWISLY